MNDLLAAIYQMLQDQHPDKAKMLAARFRQVTIDDCSSVLDFFNTDAANAALKDVIEKWKLVNCSGETLAGLIRGVSFGVITEKNNEQVDLVWTGPDLNLLPVRRSEQVLLDVISDANESLFIVSFVLVNIPKVEKAIRSAVARKVDVRILLESEDKAGSNNFETKIKAFAARLPGIKLYVWPREKREKIEGGFASVHAKCAVADQVSAFLTSANLTSAALDRNIEMGVHIKGGKIPKGIVKQFRYMIQAEEIVELPQKGLNI